MTNPPSLDELLACVLDEELAQRGIHPTPVALREARRELCRTLHPEAPIPLLALEQALERSVRLAASTVGEHDAGEARELGVGEVLDSKYAIEALLAEGGFGQVYRARDRDLDCAVAIKVLKRGVDPARIAELQEEARRLTRLRHPNIVEWKTLNRTGDGRLYLVMEYLEGELLEDVLRREGRLAPGRARRILLELLDALAHAHRLPDGSCLLHLDLKPTNVFLVQERSPAGHVQRAERVKVLDFGISRFAHAVRPAHAASDGAGFAAGETTSLPGVTGSVACTPQYCSPEQAARALGDATAVLDARSDLFSFGVLAYRMLTGRFPHAPDPDLASTLRRRQTSAALPVSAAGVRLPRRLARFVERCLARDPAERFADAREAHAELERILAPRTGALLLVCGSIAAALLGVLSFVLGRTASAVSPLHAVVRATGRSAAQEPLFFGPARPALELELVDLGAGDVRDVRLVDGSGAEVPGWQLRALDGGRFEIVADARGATRRSTAFLTLGSEGAERSTEPLELAFVDPASWDIVSADVAGRGARVLDPRGQVLEVELRGPGDALPASLALELAGRSHLVARSASTLDRATYRIDLSDVDWTAAAGVPRLHMEDRAGTVRSRPLDLPLVLEPLLVEQIELEDVPCAEGTWYVLSGEPVRLVASGNRRSHLRWTLDDASGRRIDAGESQDGALTHAVSLDSARWPAASFAGVLRVTLDEDDWVAHRSGTGEAHAELFLELRTSGAVFEVSLSGARSWVEEGRAEPVHFFGRGALRAAVYRDHDVPMVVAVACTRAGAPEGDVRELAFWTPQEERKTLELLLAEDGRHHVTLEGRRLASGGRALERADSTRELELVRDTEAPRAALEGWREPLVFRSVDEFGTHAFRVGVEDGCPGSDPPPASVAWSVSTVQDGRLLELRSGELDVKPGTASALPLELLGSLSDGRYLLALRARDFVGNEDERREYAWSVSTEGPRLEVLVPSEGAPWARASESFTVELRAEDPNGVARVECQLADEAGALVPRTVALEPAPSASTSIVRWIGRFELDHRWGGRRVRLSFRGTDALGTEALRPVEVRCTVGPIPSVVPDHVHVARSGTAGGPMRRVPGNSRVPYVFGGRGDVLENAAFRAHGLANFAGGAITSSLRLELPAGAIEDFYLDEHEVSVAQYLAFLRAADGYADRRWFDEAVGDREQRRAALERAFAAVEPELPATGLDCLEAQAFAAWTGKQLPTYVHWEYALRGLQARPYSCAGEVELAGIGTSVNVGTGASWPVTRGDDRTPDTLVLDLCSNVAEWTSTPVHRPLAEAPLAELLRPAAALAGNRHYVVGGGFERTAFHFGVIARHGCEHTSPAIGFRCMLPASRIEAAFLDRTEDLEVLPLR